MTDAPERIWLNNDRAGVWWTDQQRNSMQGDTEYIRADLVPQWQPIETAPKDGDALVYHPSDWWNVVDLGNDVCRNGQREFYNGDVYCHATHWMPLPEPPEGN